jgi:hypothetical protein
MLFIVRRQGHKTAQVVIDDPHIQTLFGLSFQNRYDRIQHKPLTEDKKLQKNIVFRLLQFFQNLLEKGLPGVEVLGLGMCIYRKPRILLEIPYLGEAILVLLRQNGQYVPRQSEKVPALPGALFYSPP